MTTGSVATDVIRHHLRLFGVAAADDPAKLVIHERHDDQTMVETLAAAERGALVLCITPTAPFCSALAVTSASAAGTGPFVLEFEKACSRPWRRLRSLHPMITFRFDAGEPVVVWNRQPVWLFCPVGRGGVLFVGTDLAGDLIRYRQGDPARALKRPTEALWGIAGERPVYLFEDQLAGEAPHERHADWWAIALAETVAAKLGATLQPILPRGAPGAIVLTGDDDQAYLEKYEEQLALIGETPITYFLHPLTRHTPKTLQTLGARVDLGLHPDSLDAPERYGELFRQQCAWFTRLTRQAPVSVRNHGFLNDGYWGHLEPWLRAGVRMSSNIPGVDGRMLNGSLLPARVAVNGQLTSHWSVLTAIGDGIRFALGMSEQAASDCVRSLGERLVESGLPGVIVLNLHPQNVSETRGMHRAALELVERGFVAWNLRECLAWFERRDGASEAATGSSLFWRLFSNWNLRRA